MNRSQQVSHALLLINEQYQGTSVRVDLDPIRQEYLYYWIPGMNDVRYPHEFCMAGLNTDYIPAAFIQTCNCVILSRLEYERSSPYRDKQLMEELKKCIKESPTSAGTLIGRNE